VVWRTKRSKENRPKQDTPKQDKQPEAAQGEEGSRQPRARGRGDRSPTEPVESRGRRARLWLFYEAAGAEASASQQFAFKNAAVKIPRHEETDIVAQTSHGDACK